MSKHRFPVVWSMAVVVVLSAISAGAAPAAADPSKRVLFITIDGLRPDVALRADMPNLRDLMARGSFTFWAQTTRVAITLPSHCTLLTGVSPEKHGVTWNSDSAADKLPNGPKVPTIFELAKGAGLSTAMVAGKAKFSIFQKPGALDWSVVGAKGSLSDEQAGEAASRILMEHQPTVMFIHFTLTDTTGHAKGWGSPEQLRTVSGADLALGQVLKTLDKLQLRDKTLIILTADHGGAALTHGGEDPRSKHIPWIVTGPGVRANYDLALDKDLTVKIEDSFATALDFLGLPIPGYCEGKVVRQIYAAAPSKLPAKQEAPAYAN